MVKGKWTLLLSFCNFPVNLRFFKITFKNNNQIVILLKKIQKFELDTQWVCLIPD